MSDRVDDARRTALRLTALAAAGAAGCLDDSGESGESTAAADSTDAPADGDSGADSSGQTDAVDEAGTRETGEATEPGAGTDGADLDLREANVTAVEFEESDGGYRFSVTLYHDDDGEDGYADWWQVENLDGERLGRRDLAHPHSTDPFTRSETVEVPDGVTCVVVRGHDQTHAYGGRAMLVNLDSGERRAVDQGAETESFDEGACP